MDKTTFAGLTHLLPGEPLSTDGYSFQDLNPTIIDRYLEVGAVGHRHDGHAALADPTDDPIVAAVAGGGGVLADTVIFATYTILDADGGETRPATAQSVTTAAPVPPPDAGPTLALDTSAGTLLTNTYLYALTFTDGNGGETTIGPSSQIQRPPGPANAEVHISGLTALLTAAGAAGWRLWRSVGGGRYGFLAAGATDTYTDDGAASLDCTMSPPPRNTTNGVNQIHVTVPNTQPAGAAQFRIYLAFDGSFGSPALAGTFPIADAGVAQVFTTIDLADGSPPAVSRSIPGASRIDATTDLDNLYWHAPVANAAALPADGNVVGDARIALDTLVVYVVTDIAPTPDTWTPLGGGAAAGTWKAPVANAAALPGSGNTSGDVRVTLDDHTLHVWSGSAWGAVGGGGGSPQAWQPLHLHDYNVDGGAAVVVVDYGYLPIGANPAGAVAYYKGADDMVHLRGVVHVTDAITPGGTAGFSAGDTVPLAHLPAGYRPAAGTNNSSYGWAKVDTYGSVQIGYRIDDQGKVFVDVAFQNGSGFTGGFDKNSLFVLDGISFRAES